MSFDGSGAWDVTTDRQNTPQEVLDMTAARSSPWERMPAAFSARACAQVAFLIGLMLSTGASAITVTPGAIPHDVDLIGVRLRSFTNDEGTVRLGIPDLQVSANRSSMDVKWKRTQRIAFTFDPVNDELLAVVTDGEHARTLEYRDLHERLAARKPGYLLADLNVMQITVANPASGSTLELDRIQVGAESLGDLGGKGVGEWTVTDFGFGSGFTLTATLTVDGRCHHDSHGSADLPSVEIRVGIAECTANADCDDRRACNGVESCDPATLRCGAGAAVLCEGPCLTGACLDPEGTCEVVPGGCGTTTTTLVVPTTTTTTTILPDPCAGACGNGVIDPACGEVCDGTDVGTARCPLEAPEGPPVCAADCRTVLFSACRPAPPTEVCGNCIDDDGDGLVDFEDPDCCAAPQVRTAAMRRTYIRARKDGVHIHLRSKLDFEPGEIFPATQEVFLQLRTAEVQNLFCVWLRAGDFRPMRGGFRFRDPRGRIASALGVRRVRVWITRDGHLRYRLAARRARMVLPAPGLLRVTVGFLDRTVPGSTLAGTSTNRCAVTEYILRRVRGGAVCYP